MKPKIMAKFVHQYLSIYAKQLLKRGKGHLKILKAKKNHDIISNHVL